VLVYPNPASTPLTVISHNPITQITITNPVGQKVSTSNYNSKQVQADVANLPAGVYFVKVNGIDVKKFVKE